MASEHAQPSAGEQTLADNELAAYLDGLLEPGRRAEVEALLDADLEVLEAVALCAAQPEDQPSARLYPGAKVGRLQVSRRIATGGMGSVYEAYDPQLGRRVALKFPRALEDQSTQVEDEARRIAAISHPNVVTVHDVGRHAGRVFMEMEFLDGADLRTHLVQRPSSWRTILGLYVQVIDALSAVHRSGVVHRDVKPENILVEGMGGRGHRAVLVDFGLASDPGLPGTLAGTPTYLAPELLAGAPASAASDQYACGVALFQALTGSSPKGQATLLPGAVDRPPRRVMACVRLAVHDDPSARHASMAAFARALERSARGRVGGSAVIVGMGLSGALLLGLASRTKPPPSYCTLAADHAEDPRFEALIDETAARYAGQELAYLRDLGPRVVERLSGRKADVAAMRLENCEDRQDGRTSRLTWRARERCHDRRRSELEIVATRLGAADADEPRLRAGLEMLGDLPQPRNCADEGLPATSPQENRGFDLLAEARLSMLAGDAEQTEAQLAAATERLAGYPAGEVDVMYRRAKWLGIRGEHEQAATTLSAGLLKAEALGDPERIALFLSEQVWVLGYRQGSPREAREIASHARVWIEQSPNPRELGFELELNLGWMELAAGRPERAQEHFEAARSELGAPGLGERDAALVENGLGSAALGLGEPARAVEHLQAGTLSMERELGPMHPDVGQMRNNLAAVLTALGRLPEARTQLDANVRSFTAAFGEHHPFVGTSYLNRSVLHLDEGHPTAAEADSRRAIAIFEVLVIDDESHLGNLARARKGLADALLLKWEKGDGKDDLEEAGRLLRSAMELQLELAGDEGLVLGETRHTLARVLAARGDLAGAIEEARAALAIIESNLGDGHPNLAPVLLSLVDWEGRDELSARAADLAGAAHCAEANFAYARVIEGEADWDGARFRARLALACLGPADANLREPLTALLRRLDARQ